MKFNTIRGLMSFLKGDNFEESCVCAKEIDKATHHYYKNDKLVATTHKKRYIVEIVSREPKHL